MVDAGNITRDSEFVLANDIDLTCYDNWAPIGKEGGAFSGTFDGNGYVIDNRFCNKHQLHYYQQRLIFDAKIF